MFDIFSVAQTAADKKKAIIHTYYTNILKTAEQAYFGNSSVLILNVLPRCFKVNDLLQQREQAIFPHDL